MLKALKIIGISITGFIFLLGVTLYILEVKYRDAIHQKTIEIIKQNFDEQITFQDFHVSFLQRFPRLTIFIDDIEIKDSTKTLLQIGEVHFRVNLWELRNKNVIVDHITINNAELNFQVDSLGNKPQILHKVKVKNESNGQSFSFDMGKFYINNSKLILGNYYKHNHTYLSIEKGVFQPEDRENDFRISGELEAFLDSMVTNDKTLFKNQSVKLNDVVLNYNKQTKELVSEKGEILANSLVIYPHLRIQPVTEGSLVDLDISSEGKINEILELMNFHLDTKLTLESPDAFLKFNFKQSGLVTPFLKPNSEIDFEVSNAIVKEEKLPYPVEVRMLSGSYTNGEKHSRETTLIKIDTIQAKVQDSYINGSFSVENLSDPLMSAHIIADIGLHHVVKDTNKLKLDGHVKLDAKYAGKVSALKKMHYTGYLAHLDLQDIYLELKEQKQTIRIPKASATLKNHLLEINRFKGTINGSDFHIAARVQNPLLHMVNKNEDLKAHLDFEFDEVYLNPAKTENKKGKKANPLESISKAILNHITTEISVKGKALTVKNQELKNINISASQKMDNISFKLGNLEYADGKITGKGGFKLGKNGISDVHADLKGHLKNLDPYLKKKNGDVQKKNQPLQLPLSTLVNLQFLVDKAKFGPFELNNLDLVSTITNSKIDIQKLNMIIEKGKINAKGNVSLDTTGFSGADLEVGFNLVKVEVDTIIAKIKKSTKPSEEKGKGFKIPEKLTLKVNFAANEIIYSGLHGSRVNTSFKVSDKLLTVEKFTGNFPFGTVNFNLSVNDYLSKNRKIKSQAELRIDTLNVDDLLALKVFQKNKKPNQVSKEKPTPSFTFPENMDIKLAVNANQVEYKKAVVNNLALNMNLNEKLLDIKNLDFLFASGTAHLNGYILNRKNNSYPCFVTADVKNVDLRKVLTSFDNFNQSVITPENTSGLFSWKSKHYISFNKNLDININDNYWVFDFLIHDAELKEVAPVQDALFFIGHKSKSNMMIKDLNVKVSMVKDKMYFSEVIMNDNIANIEVMGSYSLNDSLIDVSSKISLTDLFFRSKKERVLETLEGKIPLEQDSKIFLQLHGSPTKHKINLRSRKKTERFEKELRRQIEKANKIFEEKEAEQAQAYLAF